MLRNKRFILAKLSILGLLFLSGLLMKHQTVNAEVLESEADVFITQGVHLTAVPSFEFGKILYNGEASSVTLKDKNLGDKDLSWFDGTCIPKEGVRVYATIKEVSQPGMLDASLSFTASDYKSSNPDSVYPWWSDLTGKTHGNAKPTLKFNGERQLLVKSNIKYYSEQKKKGVTDFKINDIDSKKIDLPAGLKPMAMDMTIDWDIESVPE
ncbi:hypothetical protein AAH972_05770 [Enterococcus faecalis]|uniref:hypothetical protein n=1 Tax=Enterococcus faecalis TaxID=1351 RepID=UPI00032FF7EC|nr:hypothetical protein [Enterococcus faecalis]EOJ58828.1 hypothetical protein WMM_02207 [Enterococcus faecalis EnGen0364]